MLGVTDKAVSKWEVGEANPDISLLSELSRVFGVSIDYLLTGVVEEKISLDDMDNEKRAIYLIKKDDARSFEKYGYLNNVLLFAEPYQNNNAFSERLLDAVFSNKSISIFEKILKKNLSDSRLCEIIGRNGALALKANIDEYIKMCVEISSVEGLQAINFKYFIIGTKTSTTNTVSFHINEGYGPADPGYRAPVLSSETLSSLFSNKKLSKDMLDYLSEIEPFHSGDRRVMLMADDVIYELYKNHHIDKVTNALHHMNEYNKKAFELWKLSLNGSWYTGKRIVNNGVYFTNSSSLYLQALVNPIGKAFDLAIENKDFEFINKFNDYNTKIKENIPELKARTLSEQEIKLMELKEDKNASLLDILKLQHINYGIVDFNELINDDYGIEKDNEIKEVETKINRLKELKDFYMSTFISPYELIMNLCENKKYKELSDFATQLGYSKLEKAVSLSNKKEIEEISNFLFIPESRYFDEIRRIRKLGENIHVVSGSVIDEPATNLARFMEFEKQRTKLVQRFIDDKLGNIGIDIDSKAYSSLLKTQFKNIPFDEHYEEVNLELFSKEKELIISKQLSSLEDKLERLTNRKALEKAYNKISQELNKEYLTNELEKGESDKVVVLICKRLQIILEYKFGYVGDLYSMIDTLIERTMNQENEEYDSRVNLLHTLRMKRNNIVHAEYKEIEMSKEDIERCIDVLDVLSN